MPNTLGTETLREEDSALAEMYQQDVTKGTLTPEDNQAFLDLIEAQRKAHQDAIPTTAEFRDSNGETHSAAVKDVGDAALNAMAVHSESWHTEDK